MHDVPDFFACVIAPFTRQSDVLLTVDAARVIAMFTSMGHELHLCSQPYLGFKNSRVFGNNCLVHM